MATQPIDNNDDIIDSRDIIKRIEELEADAVITFEDKTGKELDQVDGFDVTDWLDADDAEEYTALKALEEEASGAADWQYGETLIRDSYFTDYAQQLAEDIGAIDREAGWPSYCIDWERAARDLQSDYTSVEFDGVTYWMRW